MDENALTTDMSQMKRNWEVMPPSSVTQRFWLGSVTSDLYENISLVITRCLLTAFVTVTNLESKGPTGPVGLRAMHYAQCCDK